MKQRIIKQKERGFALIISLILMLILTMIGFSAASKGKILQQITQTSVRYEEVFAAAEAELYHLMNILQKTTQHIPAGDGMRINRRGGRVWFGQVWENKQLADKFDRFGKTQLPDFTNFDNQGWNDAGADTQMIRVNGTTNSKSGGGTVWPALDLRTDQGMIVVNGFVQQLVQREVSNNDGTMEYQTQYLVTVRGYALNQADLDAKGNPLRPDIRRESVVLQSVYELSYIQ